ncbi:MAG: glutamyl-tRNA reductase, partial [Epsilonproteobacteria bacterium]|nr:glutamyl-tRNA reductase [Campylobacterota bacterium]
MHYLTVSFSHKNTNIHIREKLAFNDEEVLKDFYRRLLAFETINEAIILSTCNRVEIMTSVKECERSLDHIFNELSALTGVSKEELEGRGEVYEDNGAIHHLFTVVSSLDSLVIGETQIVGQVKKAFLFAYENKFCGQKLSRTMHHAFRCAAEVRNSTDISKNPISISSVAVAKAKEILGGSLGGYTAIVVGAGEMAELAAKHLAAAGVNLIIINRNMEKAKELASKIEENVNIEVHPFSDLKKFINRYRLLFSATGAPHTVITKDMVEETDFERHWFDIAVPRDIEDCDCKNVNIYAVDDLEDIVNRNKALREEQAKIAYSIIGKATMDFFKWLQTLAVDPM